MSRGTVKCCKYTLGISNFVVLIFGILLIVYGIKSLKHPSNVGKVVETPAAASKVCISLGVMVFGISFLGCCGALRESQCMLITFSLIMFAFVIVELIIGCFIITYRKEFKKYAKNGLEKIMKKYDSKKTNSTTNVLVDEIQSNFECCGIKDANDWISWKKSIPISCCAKPKNETIKECTPKLAFSEGCLKPIHKLISSAYAGLGGIAITISIVQSLGIVLACCVAYAVHRDYSMV